MLRLLICAACAMALLSGCGEEDDGAGGSATPPGAEPAAKLTVTVRPEGPDGPARERRIECERVGPRADEPVCRRLSTRQLAPVPERTVCTSIYGGPAVGRVTGTIRGERVDARFSRTNGCEIARWDRNAALLGKVPARP